MVDWNIRRSYSIGDVANWSVEPRTPLVIKVYADSSFAFLAEGVAITKLQNAVRRKIRITVECNFEVDSTAHLNLRKAGVWVSLFGLELLRVADSVLDSRGRQIGDYLINALWASVQTSGGILGTGNKRYIVIRDPDYSLPPVISQSGKFPDEDVFRRGLERLATPGGEYGSSFAFSPTEQMAIKFLYEAAANSHKHGREDLEGHAVVGLRGFLLENRTFANKEEMYVRTDLESILQSYLDRIWNQMSPTRVLRSVTVTDSGPGIQNTLPVKLEGAEGPWERLHRAFRPGESRLAEGSDISRGLGFTHILESATQLNSLMVIRSGTLIGYADFSQRHRQPKSELVLSYWPQPINLDPFGTSITLTWPELTGAGSQMTLFNASS